MRTAIWILASALCASVLSAQGIVLRTFYSDRSPYDSLHLTREEAVEQAVAVDSQLDASRQQIAGARTARMQGLPLPDVAAQGGWADRPDFLGGGRTADPGMGRSFPDQSYNLSSVWIRSAENAYVQLREKVAEQTARQYDSLLIVLQRRKDLTETRALYVDFLQKIGAHVTGGTATRSDVVQAQSDVAQVENQLAANERSIAHAQAGLNRYLHRPIGAPLLPLDSLTVLSALPSQERLESYALLHRPELANLESQMADTRASVTQRRGYWTPGIYPDESRYYSQQGSDSQLPFFYQERQLHANVARVRTQIKQEVQSAYASASAALQHATYIRDTLLQAAGAVFQSVLANYALGGASKSEVVEARRTLLNAESQYTSALAAASVARWDLQRAAGTTFDAAGTGSTQ